MEGCGGRRGVEGQNLFKITSKLKEFNGKMWRGVDGRGGGLEGLSTHFDDEKQSS